MIPYLRGGAGISDVSSVNSEGAQAAGDGPPPPAGRTRKQRAVMATDSDWALIQERAARAGCNVSEYVTGRLTAPPPDPGVDLADLGRSLQRVERLVRVLYEIEAHRLRQHDDAEVLDRLLQRADAAVDRERALG